MGDCGQRSDPNPIPVTGKLAYVRTGSTGKDVWIMENWTDQQTQLSDSPFADTNPELSPGGQYVAFVTDRFGGGKEIVVKPVADGLSDEHLLRLTDNYEITDDSPTWSPDGQQIAFYSENPTSYGINVMNADGSSKQLVFAGSNITNLNWSPVGNELVYTGYDNYTDSYGIYTLDINNPVPVLLTSDPANERHPVWSPDGEQIAFTSDIGGRYNIYVMDVDGSNVQSVTTTNQDGDNVYPAWSPDGSQIAFTSFSPAFSTDPYYDYSTTQTVLQIYQRDTSQASSEMSLSVLSNSAAPMRLQTSTSWVQVSWYATGQYDFLETAWRGFTQIEPTPTPTPTIVSTVTPTPQVPGFSCPISLLAGRNIRDKGNASGFVIGFLAENTQTTAYFRSNDGLSIGGEIWIQIDEISGSRGWILLKGLNQGITTNPQDILSPTSMNCFNQLPIYSGSYPQGAVFAQNQTWDQIARITQTKLPTGVCYPILSYLYGEGQQDPALLLARLAVAESLTTTADFGNIQQDRDEVNTILWVVRMRAFMGIRNYSAPNSSIILQLNSSQNVTLTSIGQAGKPTSITDEIVLGALTAATSQSACGSMINPVSPSYQPIKDVAQSSYSPTSLADNLKIAFYPSDVFALDDLFDAYAKASLVLATNWNNFNGNVVGYEEFRGPSDRSPEYISKAVQKSRPPRQDGRYPIRLGVYPNQQNIYWDTFDLDDYWLVSCALANPALALNPLAIPQGPFAITLVTGGYYETTLPPTAVCQ